MEALTITLSLLFTLGDPEFGYSAKADRSRFPRDEMVQQWMANNCRRQQSLKEMRVGVELVTMRPQYRDEIRDNIDAEIEELERIYRILFWINGELAEESVMRIWMHNARGYMTEEEYRFGKVSWGGLAE